MTSIFVVEQSGQTAGEKEKQRHDKLVSSLQRTVQSCLHGRVDKSVKAEVKDTVVPGKEKKVFLFASVIWLFAISNQ